MIYIAYNQFSEFNKKISYIIFEIYQSVKIYIKFLEIVNFF